MSNLTKLHLKGRSVLEQEISAARGIESSQRIIYGEKSINLVTDLDEGMIMP